MSQFVTGSFRSVGEANDAVDALIDAGYGRDDISVLMSNEMRSQLSYGEEDVPGETQGTRVIKDAAGGGLIGGALGAIIAGGLAAAGTIGAAVVTGGVAVPLIAGPLAAALAGGGAGAAAGGIVGALTGYGLSHEESHHIANEVNEGSIVIAVRVADDDVAPARAILKSGRISNAGRMSRI